MKNSVLRIVGYVFLTFILVIFIAGYNSDKIQEALLPRVNTFRAFSIDSIQVTVPFEGLIDVKEKESVRFCHQLEIREWFVKPGQSVMVNQPLFRISNTEDIVTIDAEKAKLELEMAIMLEKYESLNHTSFDQSKLRLMMLDLKMLQDKLSLMLSLSFDNDEDINKINDQINHLEYEIMQSKQKITNGQMEDKQTGMALQLELNKLNDNIEGLVNKYTFYNQVSEDGIFYADQSGVVSELVSRGHYLQDTSILTINLVSGDSPFVYKGKFDQEYAYLIQKNNSILLEYDSTKPPISITIDKVFEPIDGKVLVEAVIDKDIALRLGQTLSGRSLQTPGSKTNVPRTSIISKGEIKNNSRVEFYCVYYEEGLLGNTAKVVKSYGSVAYVGDDYIGLSDKTLPDSFTYIIVDNPQPSLKSGDRISE